MKLVLDSFGDFFKNENKEFNKCERSFIPRPSKLKIWSFPRISLPSFKFLLSLLIITSEGKCVSRHICIKRWLWACKTTVACKSLHTVTYVNVNAGIWKECLFYNLILNIKFWSNFIRDVTIRYVSFCD
jgi:hypothetical protein